MSRELRRVPLDFDWPLRQVWEGYVLPDRLREEKCTDCDGSGYSARARELRDRWYGYGAFDPEEEGSQRLRPDTPAVRRYAEQNVDRAHEYYGTGEPAIQREAQRLADLWNGMWCHHLAQRDVNALLEADRLWDLTREVRDGKWRKRVPRPEVTAAQVNEWSLWGMGHDSLNMVVVVRARCEGEGVDHHCAACEGHGRVERYPGQRAEAEAWEWVEPPEGEGYQLWETTSEGSPVTPVFRTLDELCEHAARECTVFGEVRATAEQWKTMLEAGFVAVEAVGEDGTRSVFL